MWFLSLEHKIIGFKPQKRRIEGGREAKLRKKGGGVLLREAKERYRWKEAEFNEGKNTQHIETGQRIAVCKQGIEKTEITGENRKCDSDGNKDEVGEQERKEGRTQRARRRVPGTTR